MEVILFLAGVALLAVEIFLIPGFGVTGIAGIILMIASLVLAFLPGDVMPETPDAVFPWDAMWQALSVVLLALLGTIVGLFIAARYLPRAPLFNELMTEPPSPEEIQKPLAASGKALDSYVGKTGLATTDLRPAGKIEVESEVLDAVAEGEFIPKGDSVKVCVVSGNRVVVARAPTERMEGASGPRDAGGAA